MAFLDPELAYQLTIAVYVHVGALAVLIWDILNNLRQDISLAIGHPLRYREIKPGRGLARLACLCFVLFVVVAQTAPIDAPCLAFGKAASWFYAPAVSITSLLFLIRLRAIFDGHTLVRLVFSGLWLCVLASCLTPALGLTNANIGTTKYCLQVDVKPYVGAATIVPLVNDTLVFLATSWKLMENAYVAAYPLTGTKGLGFRVKAFFRGDYLPAFSRGLLHDGQVYYLTTVTTNLMVAVVFHFPSVPAVYQSLLVIPNVTLMNIMACRVYRRTKQTRYKDAGILSGNVLSSQPLSFPLAFATIRSPHGTSNLRESGQEGIECPKSTFSVGTFATIERGDDEGMRTSEVDNTDTPASVTVVNSARR
ncbi:unnamed protein product [Cyclocybe aegerita]|uniref:Uncharacterized protein n=1 Tax=Cyclocybe aegerita TaxID=1973307 RepID=A0A8S0VZT7_CYCAE|nr:unnamed protein product [Cyclocybe aegerita]